MRYLVTNAKNNVDLNLSREGLLHFASKVAEEFDLASFGELNVYAFKDVDEAIEMLQHEYDDTFPNEDKYSVERL